ncbi:uncharacterized protein LOC106645636 [Copidosoma floridanum]|uniref:uncharacterized protein LOC106645636 n=1 Tax=Copidosoma floridanum TaxID=29053 RepID=UPI0006C9A5D7|nr:uncharacterized protein LOC106645636 [Copidosoma floridanum]
MDVPCKLRGKIPKPGEKSLQKSESESNCSTSSNSSGSSGSSFEIWPPKMRKKRPRQNGGEAMYERDDLDEEPRPATAVLEEPLVLDPRFIDKLDMSLLSKESLSASLIRVSLDTSVSFIDNPRGKACTEVVACTALVGRRRIGHVEADDDDSTTAGSQSLPVVGCKSRSKIACYSPTRLFAACGGRKPPDAPVPGRFDDAGHEAKKLDDNNNSNRTKHQLSPLRSEPSRSAAASTSDASVFTSIASARKKLLALSDSTAGAAACRACVRAVQPERFHSHPTPLQSPNGEPSLPTPLAQLSRSNVSIIPVRTNSRKPNDPHQLAKIVEKKRASPQSSNAPTPRSKQIASEAVSTAATTMPKALSRENSEKAGATSPKSGDERSVVPVATTKRRPRTVTCYVCGREFGSMSFPIHEPKCLERWHRENKALPASQRRSVPQRPSVPIDSEEWNTAAWEQSQALLIPCSKCKRTFLPDRLAIHERNCRIPNKVFYRNL